MKKIFFCTFFPITCYLSCVNSFSQGVGIGIAVPDASAIAEIKSNTRGLLIPRMSTAQRTAIIKPVGLMLFDLNTNSFWYRDNTGWVEIAATGNTWNLKGNSNTNPSVNYLGTSGNQPLRIRLNNQWAGELNHLTLNYSIGSDAGKAVTTGTGNTAVGKGALEKNTGGMTNTAIGFSALNSNISGNFNTAFGNAALYNNTGSYNTAIGANALFFNKGNYNSALGNQASVASNTPGITYATAIGADARVACSNCLVLGGLAVFGHQTYVGINWFEGNSGGFSDPEFSLDIFQRSSKGLVLRHMGDNNYNNTWEIYHSHSSTYVNNLILRYNNTSIGIFDDISGVYTTLSDKQFKTNIHSLLPVLEKLNLLQPSVYHYTNDPAQKQNMGFVAQQVEKLFPQLVHHIYTKGKYKDYDEVLMLDYNGFNVLAIKALQEQEQMIAKQGNEINELKKKLELLRKKK